MFESKGDYQFSIHFRNGDTTTLRAPDQETAHRHMSALIGRDFVEVSYDDGSAKLFMTSFIAHVEFPPEGHE